MPFRSDIIGPAILLSIENPTSLPVLPWPDCHAENDRRERVALLLANNAGSLADSPPTFSAVPFVLSLVYPRRPHSFSLPFLLPLTRLALTWSPRRRTTRVFVALLCQPWLLPLLPDHCANSSTYSFIPPVLSHSCSPSLSVSLFFFSRKDCLPTVTDRLRRYVAH